MHSLTGHCLCGAVAWASTGEILWSGHCHCNSCRRATGAPMTSFFGVPRASVVWTGELSISTSSNGRVTRKFCATCGTQMTYQYVGWPEETHLYAATLADPAQFQPKAHFHWTEKLPWLNVQDDLPKYPGSADTTEALPSD